MLIFLSHISFNDMYRLKWPMSGLSTIRSMGGIYWRNVEHIKTVDRKRPYPFTYTGRPIAFTLSLCIACTAILLCCVKKKTNTSAESGECALILVKISGLYDVFNIGNELMNEY